jgi:hypothetical protein
MTEVTPSIDVENIENKDENLEDNKANNNGIVTTEEELEAYHIVRAILCKIIDSERITYKDTKNYFNILFENNTWKPICRMYLNSKTIKRMGLFDQNEEYKIQIESVRDIYNYTDQIISTLAKYNQG